MSENQIVPEEIEDLILIVDDYPVRDQATRNRNRDVLEAYERGQKRGWCVCGHAIEAHIEGNDRVEGWKCDYCSSCTGYKEKIRKRMPDGTFC